MQPATGEVFRVPVGNREARRERDAHVGRLMSATDLEALRESKDAASAELAHDLDAAIASAREHGPLVGVSDVAAQKAQLGGRELARRARRRKAAKQARKRNR